MQRAALVIGRSISLTAIAALRAEGVTAETVDLSLPRDSDWEFRLQREDNARWELESSHGPSNAWGHASVANRKPVYDALRYLRNEVIGPQCPASEFEPSPTGKHLRLKKGGRPKSTKKKPPYWD